MDVAIRPLDGIVADAGSDGSQVRFLKIDVEGFEPEVVEGAGAILREHRPRVFCEFNDILLRDRGRSSSELLALFAAVGYQPADERQAAPEHLANRVVNLLLLPSSGVPRGST